MLQVPTTPVTVRMNPELRDRLDDLARAANRTRSWIVSRAVLDWLESQAAATAPSAEELNGDPRCR